MDFIPHSGKLLARQFKTTKETTDTGIYIPESAQKDDSGEIRAQVVAKCPESASPAEVGDTIVVAQHAVISGVKIGDTPYIVIDEMDILLYQPKKQ